MQKAKRQLTKLVGSEYFPFVILTLFLLFFHTCIHIGHNDDAYILSLRDINLFEHFINYYKTWSARVVPGFVSVLVIRLGVLWKILNTFIMLLGAISISKVFCFKNSKTVNWVITALIICLPVYLYTSAGWVATTTNYSWVAFLGTFSVVPIKKILCKEEIKWYEYILYIFAMIYATNHEQMCLILLTTYFVFLIYIFLKEKNINWFLALGTIFNTISLIFIITCPGTAARKIAETKNWFPEFNDLSVLRKIEMGFSSTLFEFIIKPNFLFFIFATLLLVSVYFRTESFLFRVIAFVPLTMSFIFGFLANMVAESFPFVVAIKNSLSPHGTLVKLFEPKTWVPDLILLSVCVSVLISLYILFDDKKWSVLTIFILLLGFGSRMVLSFSPTIWASGERTFTFMYLSILICSAILYQLMQKENNVNIIHFIDIIIFILSAMSFINMANVQI